MSMIMTKMMMTLSFLAGASVAVSAAAQDINAHSGWGSASIYAGAVSFEPDEVDVDRNYDNLVGVKINYGMVMDNGLLGNINFVHEMGTMAPTDDDETRHSNMLDFHLNFVSPDTFSYGAFAGLATTKDNGDNGEHDMPPIKFGGIEGSFVRGRLTVGSQVGALIAKDFYGEAYDNATFASIYADFRIQDNTILGLRLSTLEGSRRNDDEANGNRGTITAQTLSIEHGFTSKPISLWAEIDADDFNAEDESDDPWVKEIRVGLTYRFGEKDPSVGRSALPKINRWLAVATNEIE